MKQRRLVETAAITLLCALAGLAFRGTFQDWGFAFGVMFAAMAAAAVIAASAHAGLRLGSSLALSVLAYALCSSLAIYGTLTPESLQAVTIRTIDGWQRLLTVAAPADTSGDLRIVPFMTVWVGATIASAATMSTRRLLLPLVGPAVIIIASALFGLPTTQLTSLVGAIALFALVGFLVLRDEDSWIFKSTRILNQSRRLLLAATILTVSTFGALLIESVLRVDQSDRVTLRDTVTPPFELRNLRTPLVGFKASLNSEAEDQVVMTIEGPDLGDRRIRLATLDEYDGVTWSTATTRGADTLVRVGESFPRIDGSLTAGESKVTFGVALQGTPDHWMPVVGQPTEIEWGDGAAALLGADTFERIRLDATTGNLLLDQALSVEGDQLFYELTTFDPAVSVADEGAVLAPLPLIDRSLTSGFEPLAREMVAGETNPVLQLRRIEQALASQAPARPTESGAGKLATYDVQAPPGHAVHRIVDTLFADEDEYRGTAEQYATAFALLAGSIEIPARVVTGYSIAPEMVETSATNQVATVRSSDLDVWVEVLFSDVGWVTFEPGPEESASPDGLPTRSGGASSSNTVPPLSVFEEEEFAEAESEEDEVDEDEDEADEDQDEAGQGFANVGVAAAAGAAIVVPLLALGGLIMVLAILKSRRRQRRRSQAAPEAICGAWYELLDTIHDSDGVKLEGTLRQQTAKLNERGAGPQVSALSKAVEHAAFSGDAFSDVDIDLAWAELDEIERSLKNREDANRFKQLVSVRSLKAPADR